MSIAQKRPTQCKIEGCDRLGVLNSNGRRYFTKGYCKSHYRRYTLGDKNLQLKTVREPRPAIIREDIAYVPLDVEGVKYAIIDADKVHLSNVHIFHLDRQGYACTNYNGGRLLLHHLVAGRPEKGLYSDHINGNRLDNRVANIRTVTMLENNLNRRKNFNGKTSRYKGVFRSRNAWFAGIKLGDIERRKRCATEADAARQYNEWAVELFGEYARLNRIGEH